MEWSVGDCVWCPRTANLWVAGCVVGILREGRVRVVCHRGIPHVVTRYGICLEPRDPNEEGRDIPRRPPYGRDGINVGFGPVTVKGERIRVNGLQG